MYGMSTSCVPNSCSYLFVNSERARPWTRHWTRRSFRICLTVQYMYVQYVLDISTYTWHCKDYPIILNVVKNCISFAKYFLNQRILRAFRKQFTVKFS
jgi:hypothetical protein